MFKLLLTVFLGVCVGAVVADLLFGPDQPATPSSDSQGQQWEPWRSWYLSARDHARRALAVVVAWCIAAAEATDRAARRLAGAAVAAVRLVPDTLRAMGARRRAMAERTAAHARHVAHLEAVTPWRDPLPPPVAPPLHPDGAPAADPRGPFPSVTPSAPAAPGAPAPAMSGPVGPPVPARARRQRLVDTSEMPIDGGPGAAGRAENGNESETRVESFGPLGRPPWDALVRRPLPREAPTPLADGPRGTAGRARSRSRRDPLDWMPRDAERPPDPEWDDGVPVPLSVPLRVRARSGAVLLALTGVFGVLTATALLVAVVMAVGALDKL